VVYGAGALVFGLGALLWAHGIAWLALRPAVGSIWASVSLLAFDLLVAGVCVTLAALSKPGPVEVEAQRLKELALAHLPEALTLPALFPTFAGLINRKRRPVSRPSPASRQSLRA
jgi:putative exporter of polyketide antibiotics